MQCEFKNSDWYPPSRLNIRIILHSRRENSIMYTSYTRFWKTLYQKKKKIRNTNNIFIQGYAMTIFNGSIGLLYNIKIKYILYQCKIFNSVEYTVIDIRSYSRRNNKYLKPTNRIVKKLEKFLCKRKLSVWNRQIFFFSYNPSNGLSSDAFSDYYCNKKN